jgi:hypothetical protein
LRTEFSRFGGRAALVSAITAHTPVRALRATALPAAIHTQRTPPLVEINNAYQSFANDFAQVAQAYVASISSSITNTVPVSTSVTQPYISGSTSMQVDDASVFGPNGVFAAPLTASATVNGVPVGNFTLVGRSNNTLFIDVTNSSQVNLSQGTVINANVSGTSQTSAAAIFPTFIVNRSQQMAIQLVNYFNSLPLKLPKFNAPPHTPTQRGAIQSYIYQQIAGSASTSLMQSLLLVPLPTTASSDLFIYESAAVAAIKQSQMQTTGGVRQVFAGRILVPAPAPANRLGVPFSGSTGSGSTSGTSGTSTTATGTGSTGSSSSGTIPL